MEKDSRTAFIVEELDKLEDQLSGYEKILKNEAVSADISQKDIVSAETKKTPEKTRTVSDSKCQDNIRQLSQQIEDLKRRLEQLDEISSKLELLDEMDEELNYIRNFLDTRLNHDFEAMYRNILDQMNVEAIKVYRNIQAVIVEEEAKQNHVLFGVDGKSDKLKFRMNHVMIFSIISFVVSILVMLMQILPALGIEIF